MQQSLSLLSSQKAQNTGQPEAEQLAFVICQNGQQACQIAMSFHKILAGTRQNTVVDPWSSQGVGVV